jgi:hypothetical protein
MKIDLSHQYMQIGEEKWLSDGSHSTGSWRQKTLPNRKIENEGKEKDGAG